jgi:hypothetical protein
MPKHVCQVAKQRSRRCTDIDNKEFHTSLHPLFRPAQSTDRSERRQLSGGVLRGRVRESRCYLFRGVPTERLVQTHLPLETFGNDTEARAHRSQSAFPDDDDWQMTVPPPRQSRPVRPAQISSRRSHQWSRATLSSSLSSSILRARRRRQALARSRCGIFNR